MNEARDAIVLDTNVVVSALCFPRSNEKITICRDLRDNQFLELSAAGRTDYPITGDGDLLTLGSFRATAIHSHRS